MYRRWVRASNNNVTAIAIVVASSFLTSIAHGEGQCVMKKVAELTATQSGQTEVVAAEINDHPVSMVLALQLRS